MSEEREKNVKATIESNLAIPSSEGAPESSNKWDLPETEMEAIFKSKKYI